MTSAEKEVGIIAKLVTANENLQAAIDAQQVKLDKHRSDDFESRFYEACEAVAKEKVRNAILQGENKALKSKRIAEGKFDTIQISEAVMNAIHYQNGAAEDIKNFERSKHFDPLTESERFLNDAIGKLHQAMVLYAKAMDLIL